MQVEEEQGGVLYGLRFCGLEYMRAFEEYKELGDSKFEAAMQDKRILGAAQTAYAIAAQNGMNLIKMLNDPTSVETKELTKKLQ